MNQQRLMKVILAPVVSEKSSRIAEQQNQMTLRVLPDANKAEIKAAVELLFGVKVDAVNTVVTKGKAKTFGRHAGKRQTGRRSDVKKAYVVLAEGQSLDLESAAASVETENKE